MTEAGRRCPTAMSSASSTRRARAASGTSRRARAASGTSRPSWQCEIRPDSLSWSGGRGQLPTRGSHRSGRAQLRHPAPRMMASLLVAPSSAILRGCVEMTSRPNVPVICPPASPIIRSAASLPPGPLGQVPRPHRYYQPTPTSRLPSRLASSPSLGTTTASPLFAPPGRDDSPRSRTTSTAAPAPPLVGGENETSQVPGQPLRTCSALRPRRTTDPRPLQDR